MRKKNVNQLRCRQCFKFLILELGWGEDQGPDYHLVVERREMGFKGIEAEPARRGGWSERGHRQPAGR